MKFFNSCNIYILTGKSKAVNISMLTDDLSNYNELKLRYFCHFSHVNFECC